jgi:predicted transcriptional regulator of viral defense system
MTQNTIKFPVVTTQMLKDSGANFSNINQLIEDDKIVRIKRGYYLHKDALEYPHRACFATFRAALYTLESAAFIYGYLSHEPAKIFIAASKQESRKKYKSKVLPVKMMVRDEKYFHVGYTQKKVEGFLINITDRERTVLDCIRHSKRMDTRIYGKIIAGYIKDEQRNVKRLVSYAMTLRLLKRVDILFEPWLGKEIEIAKQQLRRDS